MRCGKSVIARRLRRLGFRVVSEAARTIIIGHKKAGKPVEELYKDQSSFQKAILDLKMSMENGQSPDETVWFDRGMPSSVAYCLLHGLDPTEAIAASFRKYRRVYIFEPLPILTADYAQQFDIHHGAKLHPLMIRCYLDLGYRFDKNLFIVPVSSSDKWESIRQRIKFIMERL